MLKLRMYPAGNGDSFLISAAGSNVLIDGGYAKTFDDHIAGDLQEVSRRGERVDLVIATHIDADHISGLIRLLTANGSSDDPKLVQIGRIWHNSLRSLTSPNVITVAPLDREILEDIRRRGHPEIATETAGATEISARQGSSLASLIRQGGYRWNTSDGTTSINFEHTSAINLPAGSVQVIGPSLRRLTDLHEWWTTQLRRMGYRGATGAGDVIDDAFEFMCEHAPSISSLRPIALSADSTKRLDEVYEPDASVTNGSSIAAIIELNGVRVLMLGDAWAEDVVRALRQLKAAGYSMTFDAIKISHHGSLHNTSPELLEIVDAPVYLVSSNGVGHDHPDFEVLAAIVDRPALFSRRLYLNYRTPASARIRTYQPRGGTPFVVNDGASNWIEIGPFLHD